MTVAILISGSLFRSPEQRTSQAGKSYVGCTIKAGDEFWRVMAFSTSAGDELMRLGVGERLAVQGSPTFGIYNGKVSLSVFVDHVLALRAPPKERKPKATAAKAAPAAQESTTATDPGLNDEIGF